jgi:hypothetical protein
MKWPRTTPRFLSAQDFADALLDGLKRLPVAPRRQRVPVVLIALVRIGVPVASADLLDKSRADLVALDGERVMGVVDVNLFLGFCAMPVLGYLVLLILGFHVNSTGARLAQVSGRRLPRNATTHPMACAAFSSNGIHDIEGKEAAMLVLTRWVGETVVIGGNIAVTVVRRERRDEHVAPSA